MTITRQQIISGPMTYAAFRFRVQVIRGTDGPEHVDLRIIALRDSDLRRVGTLCCAPREAQDLIDLFGEVSS